MSNLPVDQRSPSGPSAPTRRAGRAHQLAGAAVVVGCALACSLPLLLAGGAALTVGGLLSGAWPIAVIVLAVTAAVAGARWWLPRRRSRARTSRADTDANADIDTDGSGGCGC